MYFPSHGAPRWVVDPRINGLEDPLCQEAPNPLFARAEFVSILQKWMLETTGFFRICATAAIPSN
jgi:hypothetical protein